METSRTASTTSPRFGLLAAPRARQLVGVVTFTILTAASAKFAFPIPGTAVPFTFQTLAVVLAGALLGARLGAASQVLYLALGVIGVPVFFGPLAGPAYLLGPTTGYLLAYPIAAYLTGRFAGRSVIRTAGAMTVGLAAIYAGGLSWLAVQAGWAAAINLGLLPFLAADLVKVALAVAVSARLRERCLTLFNA